MQRSEHYDKIILFRLPNTAESHRPVPSGSKYKYNSKYSFKYRYKSSAECHAIKTRMAMQKNSDKV